MSGLFLTLLVVAGLVLGIAFCSATFPLDRSKLTTAPDWLAPRPDPATPQVVAPVVETGCPPQTPAAPASARPARLPEATPDQSPADASDLTPPQIFALLESGKITTEEAIALLTGEPPPPAALAPPPAPLPEPTPDPGTVDLNAPDPPGRGSAAWISRLEYEVQVEVNRQRRQASVAPLESDQHLAAVARRHSRDMALYDYFAHENRAGQSPTDRGLQAGYRCFKDHGTHYTEGIAENLLQTSLYSSIYYVNEISVRKTYMSISEIAHRVVQGWMDSPGHRRNLLEASYERQGIGAAVSVDEKVYVAQKLC